MAVIKWTALLLLMLIQLVTVVLLINTERFYIEKQQLLKDPEFIGNKGLWQQKGEGTVLHNGRSISIVNDGFANHAVFQTVPIERSGHYTVSFDVAMNQVQGVAEGYGRAEVFVIYRNELGSTYGGGKRIFTASGTAPLTSYIEPVYLADNIGSVDLTARLNNASGKFTFASPVFSRLQEFALYKKVRASLVVLWGFIFLGLAFVAWRVFPRLHAIVLGGALTVAVVGVLLPESMLDPIYRIVEHIIPASFLSNIGQTLAGLFGYADLAGSEVGKMGHFTVFLVLGIIAGANYKKIGILFSIAGLATFAALTEALQLLVSGRTTSINDFFIDLIAGLIGICIGLVIFLFFGGKPSTQVDFASLR